VIVGMEVHLQLRTRSKCFCPCPVTFGEQPNTTTCPVCLGLPGALPVLNREALRLAVRAGLALSCAIAPRTKWDRKNYFYPDLPKGYQISQYDLPLCHGGSVPIDGDDGAEKRVRVRRAHLEEDTGKSFHVGVGKRSRLDFNRCGTPLLEIVTEPDLASAEEAGRYLQELRDLVAYVGVSDGNMEQGNLRCEPNVNLAYANGDRTPIVEVKNVNSVKNVMDAIRFETARQDADYRERGVTAARAPRSTRGWDDARGETVHQRSRTSRPSTCPPTSSSGSAPRCPSCRARCAAGSSRAWVCLPTTRASSRPTRCSRRGSRPRSRPDATRRRSRTW
jgi:aspartyl-tRNA(Asn)/glutamyl-tRNA(Gln) amidotransferase subunit B